MTQAYKNDRRLLRAHRLGDRKAGKIARGRPFRAFHDQFDYSGSELSLKNMTALSSG